MGEHAGPERRDFVVCQTYVTRANCAARETTDNHSVRIATELFANPGQIDFAVIDRGFPVSPPLDSVFRFALEASSVGKVVLAVTGSILDIVSVYSYNVGRPGPP